jgi:hypothetical protein
MYTYSVTHSEHPIGVSLPLWPSRSRAASYTFTSGDTRMRHANIFAHSHCRCCCCLCSMILPCSPALGRIPKVTSIEPPEQSACVLALAQCSAFAARVFGSGIQSCICPPANPSTPSSGFPNFGRFSDIPPPHRTRFCDFYLYLTINDSSHVMSFGWKARCSFSCCVSPSRSLQLACLFSPNR